MSMTNSTPAVGVVAPAAAVSLLEPERSPDAGGDTRTLIWQHATLDFVLQCYEDMAMQRMIPHFEAFDREMKQIVAVEEIPNPREVSTTHRDNVDLVMETPGQEPTLGWPYFVRGVAACSMLVNRAFYPGVKEMLLTAAEQVIAGGAPLPALDGDFSASVVRGERIIFTNGEHSSWRPLVAFMQGAYWLLSFVEKPKRRRGNYSPLEFVEGMVNHFGRAGAIPL